MYVNEVVSGFPVSIIRKKNISNQIKVSQTLQQQRREGLASNAEKISVEKVQNTNWAYYGASKKKTYRIRKKMCF